MPINTTKIKEISEQAKKQVPHGLGVDKWIDTYNELFAELIVKECMELVEDYQKQRTHTTWYNAAEQIKQNFGVE